MSKIYLARHGQNLDNVNGVLNGHRDLPLTDIGREQARMVAQKIKAANLRFDHVFTSPLRRASQTATIITGATGAPTPVEMRLLIERDFGVMTGLKQSQIEELCAPDVIKTEAVTYFLNPENAETFPDLLLRAHQILKVLGDQYADKNVLLVTHGDIGKMIYAAYYQLDWSDVLRLFHFGNSELLLLSEVSRADEAHVFKILQFNS